MSDFPSGSISLSLYIHVYVSITLCFAQKHLFSGCIHTKHWKKQIFRVGSICELKQPEVLTLKLTSSPQVKCEVKVRYENSRDDSLWASGKAGWLSLTLCLRLEAEAFGGVSLMRYKLKQNLKSQNYLGLWEDFSNLIISLLRSVNWMLYILF